MSANVDNTLLDLDACNDVVIALSNIKHRWDTLGTHLKISNPSIMSIYSGYGDDHFRKLSALISCWLRREKPGDHPSWKNLCIALENMGENLLSQKIASKHKCTSCVGSFTIDVDELSKNIVSGVSALETLRASSAKITDCIGDPVRFANDLCSMGLISPHEVEGLIDVHGLKKYDKSTKLMNSLSRTLRTKDDPVKLLYICKALEQQGDDVLNELVKEILQKIIAPTTTTIQVPSMDSQQNRDTEVDIDQIKTIFAEKGEKLKEVISSDILQRASEKLVEKSIIAKDDKEPSFDNIVKQFIDGLDFLDGHDEVEKHCQLFLSILHESGQGIGGPFSKCIQWLQKRFNQLGYSINII